MTDQINPQSVQTNSESFPHGAEGFGKVPQPSESFGNVPNASEAFRTVPKDSERFRSVPHPSERKENHTLTVREAARMFEADGVARTERSIVNWCQPNRQGVARLDSYFDTNEHKYFITAQSVESAIEEEKARATKRGHDVSEPGESVPKAAEASQQKKRSAGFDESPEDARTLQKEIMDLKILNGCKDFLIEQLRKEREGMLKDVIGYSRQIGKLETELRQLSAPRPHSESDNLRNSERSEQAEN